MKQIGKFDGSVGWYNLGNSLTLFIKAESTHIHDSTFPLLDIYVSKMWYMGTKRQVQECS